MKKVISFILALCTVLSSFGGQAYALTTDTAGEKSINAELDDYIKISNGEFSNNVLHLLKNSEAVYEIYVPFDTASIDIVCPQISNAEITIKMNEYTYTAILNKTSNRIETEPNLIKGEYRMTISANKDVLISSVSINRAKMLGNRIIGSNDSKIASYETMPDLTEFEKAIQTAVILKENSPVITVNGGRRYVNNDNEREVPYIENGEIYLPIHSFSRAFEYYYEKTEGKWIITRDEHTFRFENGVLTRQDYSSEPYRIDDISKNINGEIYLPIRYFAELSGKCVKEKNGVYVVEYSSNIRKIFKDEIFSELLTFFKNSELEEETGTTYYVSRKCLSCDDNDGTYEKPFKTIQKAAEVAKAGDTVIIDGGVYYETLSPKNNGTASNPITFKAMDGEKVTISAAANLGAPVGTYKNSYGQELLVYNALKDLGYGKNQLFYGGENLQTAIHPNVDTNENMNFRPEKLASIWGVQGNIKVSQADSSVLTSSTDLNQEQNFWTGATVIAYTGNAWSLGTAKVEKSEKGKLYITDKTKEWWFASKGDKTDYAWITNHINAIDMPGEWAIKDGKIYVLPPKGENAESLQIKQKVRQVAVDLSDSKFIRIEGIDIFGGGVKMNNSEMCMLRDGNYEYISHYTYSLDQRDGFIDDGNRYDKNGAPQRGEMGIYLGGRDNIILNNTIQYSAAAGIYSVGRYEYIENNAILDCGYMSSYVGGLFIGTQGWEDPTTPRGGNAIYSNTLMRSGRHAYGYSTSEDWYSAAKLAEEDRVIPAFLPSEFAYNDIKDGSIHARDTAPWYQYGLIAGTERLKTRDHHNTVANSWANDGTMNSLVYYDGQTSMFQFYNNVMYYTNNDVKYQLSLYRQESEGSQTVTDEWNNSDLGYVEGGKEAIASEAYPNGKVFASGADWFLSDKTPLLNSEKSDFINLSNAEISDGAKIENGLFKPSKDGDWICFGEIDFKNYNKLSVYYTGNYCNTRDTVSVIIGNSLNDYTEKQQTEMIAYAPTQNAVDVHTVRFSGISGKKKLYIRVDDFKSVNIEKIKLESSEDAMAGVKVGCYADESEFVVQNGAGFAVIPEGETHTILNKTSGTVIKFANVEIPSGCDTFYVRACSKGELYKGQKISLRIGSNTEEATYATFQSKKDSWYDYSVESVKTDKPLPVGKYDIYIKFESGKYSNFLWFGLGEE